MSLYSLLQRIPQALWRGSGHRSFAAPSIINAVDKRLDIGSAGYLPLFPLDGSAPGKQTRRDQRRHCRRPGACHPHWRAHHKQNPNTTPSAVEA